MPIIIDNEEYLSIEEACDYLGGISRETLRRRADAYGIRKYTRGVTRRVYYRKSDLDRLNEFRPIDDDREED
jgi:excisionase family DNA binding protein